MPGVDTTEAQQVQENITPPPEVTKRKRGRPSGPSRRPEEEPASVPVAWEELRPIAWGPILPLYDALHVPRPTVEAQTAWVQAAGAVLQKHVPNLAGWKEEVTFLLVSVQVFAPLTSAVLEARRKRAEDSRRQAIEKNHDSAVL